MRIPADGYLHEILLSGKAADGRPHNIPKHGKLADSHPEPIRPSGKFADSHPHQIRGAGKAADGHPQQIRLPGNLADDHPRQFFFSRLADFYALQPFDINNSAKSSPPTLLFSKSLVVLKTKLKPASVNTHYF